jgi:hypothetical protein
MFVGPSGLFTPLEAIVLRWRLGGCLVCRQRVIACVPITQKTLCFLMEPNQTLNNSSRILLQPSKSNLEDRRKKTLAESLCYRSLLHLCLSLASSSSRTACILIRQAPFLSSPPSHDRKMPVPPAFVSSFHQMPATLDLIRSAPFPPRYSIHRCLARSSYLFFPIPSLLAKSIARGTCVISCWNKFESSK